MSSSVTIKKLNQYFDQKEAFLDAFIDSGSDQELFIASYIHGHFSVEAAKIMSAVAKTAAAQHSFEQYEHSFVEMINKSIHQAIDNNELEDRDAKQVVQMLDRMFVEK